MGFLTTVLLRNDCIGQFQKDPKALGEAILKAMDEANYINKQVDGPGCIKVEPSRHADHSVLFIQTGNTLHVIGEGERDWKDLIVRNPECAKSFYAKAKAIMKCAGEALKKGVEKP